MLNSNSNTYSLPLLDLSVGRLVTEDVAGIGPIIIILGREYNTTNVGKIQISY